MWLVKKFCFSLVSAVCIIPISGLLNAQDYSPSPTYYTDAEGLLGSSLRNALHDIIDGQNGMNYSNDLPILWSVTEADPNQPGQILLIYSGYSVNPDPTAGGWNREHTWPRSYGAEVGSAYNDAHHLYPCDANVNETRLNYVYDYAVVKTPVSEAPGSYVDVARSIFEPRDEDKGRIARAQLYMDLRYAATDFEGDLQLSDFPNSSQKRFGKLTTLLEWNRRYPPDDRERMRNHTIQKGFFYNNKLYWQGNRNPFVDFPELGDALHTASDFVSWGSWRIENFSFIEILDDSVSGAIQDPDQDQLSNLFELSQNSDPNIQTVENLPQVLDAGTSGGREFTFNRIWKADRSYITFAVEHSEFPIDESSWQSMDINEQNSVVTRNGMMESVAFRESSLPQSTRKRHYRLKVTRQLPDNEAVETWFNPVIHNEPESDSIFLYADHFDDTWAYSDWMGYLADRSYPWIYHENHNWIWIGNRSERNTYLYDRSFGWFWTGYDAYPFVFSFTLNKWLYFVEQTSAPNRVFIDVATGLEHSE